MSVRVPPYKTVLLITDILLVYVSFSLAMLLRFGDLYPHELLPAVFLPFLAGLIFEYNDLYKVNIFLDRSSSTVLVSKSIGELAVIYVLGGFLSSFAWIQESRLLFLLFVLTTGVVFAVYRIWLLPAVFTGLRTLGMRRRRMLIIGAGGCGKRFASELTANSDYGLEIVGFVDDAIPVGTKVLNGYEVLGDTLSLNQLVIKNDCDELAIAINNISHSRLLSIITEAKNTPATVKVVSHLFKAVSDATVTEAYTIHPTATITRGLYSPITFVYQRLVDELLATIGLVILSPFLLIAAVLIKVSSKGPVFYMHERVGKDGKLFKMYKFRSMQVGGSKDDKREKMMIEFMKRKKGSNGNSKVIDDSRLTWIGRIMRKVSFDELPQLINVVLGDMSLVGPRPVLPYEYDAMEEWHHERESVLPGCTGFWQVYGRGKTTFDDMVIMDLYMIGNFSPWLYLQLVLKTFPVLIFGEGDK